MAVKVFSCWESVLMEKEIQLQAITICIIRCFVGHSVETVGSAERKVHIELTSTYRAAGPIPPRQRRVTIDIITGAKLIKALPILLLVRTRQLKNSPDRLSGLALREYLTGESIPDDIQNS